MLFPGLLTFSGCCTNVISMELISQLKPVPSNLITAFQYLFISLAVAPFLPRNNDKRPPFQYFLTTSLFFLCAIANNLAFKYGISVPVHIVTRSASTPLTVIIGSQFFGRRYSIYQIAGAIILSAGITITTLSGEKTDSSHPVTLAGLLLVLASTLLGVVTSFWNNKIMLTQKLNWVQTLFYTHFYGLPSLLLISNGIIAELQLYGRSSDFWRYAVLNTGTQLVCVTGVNMLAQKTDPLTLGVVLLLRRFASFVISLVFFSHNLGALGYLGMLTASMGALIYQLDDRLKKMK
ncbi:hypothetical protein KL938_004777 [Ogataea parapolymorpha]|nr:hypothetical protein KL938_004777 [Ogataea parapolymorpha]